MNNWKDVTQYATAVASFLSGVAMAFASFIRNNTVEGEILGFIGECFTLTGGTREFIQTTSTLPKAI